MIRGQRRRFVLPPDELCVFKWFCTSSMFIHVHALIYTYLHHLYIQKEIQKERERARCGIWDTVGWTVILGRASAMTLWVESTAMESPSETQSPHMQRFVCLLNIQLSSSIFILEAHVTFIEVGLVAEYLQFLFISRSQVCPRLAYSCASLHSWHSSLKQDFRRKQREAEFHVHQSLLTPSCGELQSVPRKATGKS